MAHYSILLGSAPEDYRQKKIEEMFDFLDSKRNKGDSIVTFANGISEIMLEAVLDNTFSQMTVDSEQTTGLNVRHCEPQQDCHCERSEAILESDVEDCFVADAPRNDATDSNAPRNDANCHSELDSESNDEMLKQPVCRQARVQHDGNICHCEPQQNRHCERSEAILESNVEDCFVANAPRNDVVDNNAPRNDVADSNASSNNENSNSILLYICTLRPAGEDEKSFWLGKEEIRCDVISHYQTLAKECGIDMQVVLDCDSEMVSEEELGWEDVSKQTTVNSLQSAENSEQMLKQVQHDNNLRQSEGDCNV